MAKIKSIRKYNRIRKTFEAVVGTLIPGTWHIFVDDRAFTGILVYFLFFGSALLIFKELGSLGSWLLVAPVLMIAVLVFLVNGLAILPRLKEE